MKSSNQQWMKWLCFAFFGIIIFSVQSCNSQTNHKKIADKEKFLLGGIQVDERDQQKWVSVLKDVKMNTVSITIYGNQGYWNYDHFWEKDTTRANVINEIKIAKNNGMKVVVIPRVVLDNYFDVNDFMWHGMIMPKSDSLIESWFTKYTSFVDRWAKISEKYDVDVFAIGSELRMLSQTQPVNKIPELEKYYLNPKKQEEYIQERMSFKDDIPKEDLWVHHSVEPSYDELEQYLKDEVAKNVDWAKEVAYQRDPNPIKEINERRVLILKEWYKLIATIRESYSGKMTYAANFDNYNNIAFWDKLDFIGINAYFKLRQNRSAQTDNSKYKEIKNSWKNIFDNIMSFQAANNIEKPVIFTELGYTFKEECTLMPWQGHGFSIVDGIDEKELIVWSEQTDSEVERTMAIKALRETNEKYNLLQGILYWKLSTYEEHKKYEPFVLVINHDTTSTMLKELQGFRTNLASE